jgi:hypothetical protein
MGSEQSQSPSFCFRFLRYPLACPASPSSTPFEGAALIFAEATPNTVILVRIHCVLQAHFSDAAACAHGLCSFNLIKSWPSVSNREKQFGVCGETRGFFTPIHWNILLK